MAEKKKAWSEGLTSRQAEACTLVAQGHTNREAARLMGLDSEQSVKNLLREALKILGCENRVQLTLIVHGIQKRTL